MSFKLIVLAVLVTLNLEAALCAPGDVSFVVSSTEKPKEGDQENDNGDNQTPVIYAMDITSNVTNRYAKTLIISRVRNPAITSKEATFSVVLPQKAFISEFVMEIGREQYKAYVAEKEEAQKIYDKAVSHGQSAAHVAISARDSNTFTVSVNIEKETKANFLLTYEELLERKKEQYELVLNIHPGQIVDDLNVQVIVNETRPLAFVRTPSLRSGNEITKNDDKLDPDSSVEVINSTSAVVKFHPDALKQKQFAKELGGKESDGLAGQFVVQYDVERDPHGGEVLLQDGYFVHFFAPKDTEVLPKNVYFILDTSGSMYGQKLQQLKDAMTSILNEIKPEDTLTIVEFNSQTFVWDIVEETSINVKFNNYKEPFDQLSKLGLPGPASATKENIDKAKNLVANMTATGGTYMIGGLEAALYLVKTEADRIKGSDNQRQPTVIFLTDGQANIGLRTSDDIVDVVTNLNKEIKAPIFTLSFGDAADKSFLRKLSLKNSGFSRQIYEAADASLQLQEFYRLISSPLLSNVHFKYDSEATDVTETEYPVYFHGGEIVVAGVYRGATFNPSVDCIGKRGPLILRPRIQTPVTSLERLWAYLTVRETLSKREAAEDKTPFTKKALKIALKYSFVTEVTSLVVVRPNATEGPWPRPYPRRPYPPQVQPILSESEALRPGSGGAFAAQGDSGPSRFGSNAYHKGEEVIDLENEKNVEEEEEEGKVQVHPVREPLPIHRPVTTPVPTPVPIHPPPTETPKNTSTDNSNDSPLESSLKWLSAALNANGTLTLPTGIFKLGDKSLKVTPSDVCAKTPKGEEGVCSLIIDCPEVFPLLTDFEVYKQFSCAVKNESFKLILLAVLLTINLKSALCAPGDVSFIVSTERPKEGEQGSSNGDENQTPKIYEMIISSNVTNRYARTLITSRVRNPAETSKEATFSVVLPKKAFISEFIMEIGREKYKAYVAEKEEAKKIYEKAVSHGQSAAHVAVSARDSNTFTVSVNIEKETKANFLLTYEELLERKKEQYELVLNIHPGQVVDNLDVQVIINETRPLAFVKTPSLRSGKEVSKNDDKLEPSSSVEVRNDTSAIVKFHPDAVKQKQFALELGGKESDGLAGQFVVQYDVERDPHGGEVLLQDGYFVHFFAPKDTEVLPKNAYFILDTSGSMYGQKLQQLKDAMSSILDEIKPEDTITIVEFNSQTFVWDIEKETTIEAKFNNYKAPFEQLSKLGLPGPAPATKENIERAKNLVKNMTVTGGTYMIGGLEAALYLVKTEADRVKGSDNQRQPTVMFLTDGQANIGLRKADEIIEAVTNLNKEIKAPIFTLSFGDAADKSFLRKLSLKNSGFSRQIYEAADASLQLQEFYGLISSPLLSNVHFKYDSEATDVTETEYPIFYSGGEIVVAGIYRGSSFDGSVNCIGRRGPITLRPRIQKPVNSLERLWAYLTVKETLEKRENAEDKTALTKKALKIALKYSFVTEVTSLVVVRPNITEGWRPFPRPYHYYGGYGNHMSYNSYARAGMPVQSTLVSSRYGGYIPSTTARNIVKNKPVLIPVTPTTTTTTEASKHTPERAPKSISLESSLKWLSAALNANGTITLPAGIFKLGDKSLNITPSDKCAKTPEGKEGLCSLMKDCPEVFPLLTDFEVYKQSSCILNNEYAGVCCPVKKVEA